MAKKPRYKKSVVRSSNGGQQMATKSQTTGIVTNVNAKMPRAVELAVLEYVRQCWSRSDIDNKRDRFKAVDLAYNHEPLSQTDQTKSAKLDDRFAYTVPIVKPDIDAVRDYLVQTFLSANQLLTVVAGPDQEDKRKQMQAVINESVDVFKTQQELGTALSQIARYNFGAVEVNWEVKVSRDVAPAGTAGESAAVDVVTFAGNNIKQLDPYNVFYDPDVPVTKISEQADFVGYIERMSLLRLYSMFSNFKTAARVVNHETQEMYASLPAVSRYYEPEVNPKGFTSKPNGGVWGEYWGSALSMPNQQQRSGNFEVMTVYLRFVPALFGWTNAPLATELQLWRFVIVNDQFIVLAEKVNNPHDFVNILVTIPDISGLGNQAKSMAESLMPFQTLGSELWELRRAGLYRSVGDRGIYDPRLIDKSMIESKNPRAKIPLKASVRGAKPNEAYYPIPYRDDTASTLSSEISTIRQHANEISGTNNTVRGQFQKGNKTRYEYQDVQQNAISGQAVLALIIESQLFVPLKKMVKMNILLNQDATELYDAKTHTSVEVNPVDLRNAALAFKVADGVATTKTMLNTDALREGFMFISQSPEFQMEYDVGRLFAHMMSLENADLADYKRNQQEQQQYVERKQQLTAAATPPQQGAAPDGAPTA